ncbi:MAG: hypothetical protein DI536_07785 [Archangium gephyra]|uniref:Lipoprotein n=1 Tax=Archangium gephyra TaxID=48 RepID=A0A2W5TNC0_9BACT|nr:MAG: hypothetical protein DI536_07785 [Archangium gephyra]
MKKLLTMCALAAVGGLVACGGGNMNPDGGTGGGSGGGTASGGGTGTNDFSTSARILAHLEGKTMVMQGDDIPTSPNGFNENIDFGASTQCYQKVSISTLASQFTVTSDLGTLNKMPDAGAVGMCDRTTKANTVMFTSMSVLIENVANNGECFDITSTYNGFKQEGRGSISADGKTVTLELYFAATGHRCADGAVGATGVQLATQAGPVAFTGNAKQVYRLP